MKNSKPKASLCKPMDLTESYEMSVRWQIPSLNTEKYRHWRVALRNAKAAQKAFASACLSSPSVNAFLTMITSSLAASHCETPSQRDLGLTTPTSESNGSTSS